MPFPRLLRKFSQPNLTRTTTTDHAGRSPSSNGSNSASKQQRQPSEPVPTLPRPWRRKTTSTGDRAGSSSPVTSKVESVASEVEKNPLPMSLPAAGPDVYLTNLSVVPHTEMMSVLSPVSDTLAEAWDAVKDGPKDSNKNPRLNTVGASSVPGLRLSAVD